jgi:chloramphenicol O-acetyltransferase
MYYREYSFNKYEKGGEMADRGMMAKGGNVEDEFMGFNVMINTKKDYNKFKKLYSSDADEMGDNTLFFSFDNDKNANKKIKEIENNFKQLNIDDYFIQNVYSSEFN